MAAINVVTISDMDEAEQNRKNKDIWNDYAKKALMKAIANWDIKRDDFKFQFFHALIINGYYTKDLANAINKDYPER